MKPGDKLGPYEILAPIGAGGMGEVYKARDTRLDRIVAIKVSKIEFSERFEREARAVAALNHPNICQLYDVGPNYLVMEYIEGAPPKGPLPLDQALKYAAQICDAVDAAHKKGITHRDLKPANILVTKVGVKLLDFGLAKIGAAKASADDATMTMALTGQGQILGTMYYMSPEQLQGHEADARSDIFSFGLVLYEMLTGKRAFEGASQASVIAAILERPAPSIADFAPAALDRVLKKCLAKNPDDRWQTARDLKDELEWISSAPEPGKIAPSRSRMNWAAWAVTAVLAVIALLGWMRTSHPAAVGPSDVALSIVPPSGKVLAPAGGLSVDRISPDGSMVLFRAVAGAGGGDSRFYVRKLNSLESELLPAFYWAGDPFWAPDSQSIAFPTDNGRLMKMRVPKGSPELITKDMTGAERGGSWGEKGIILFAQAVSFRGGVGLYSVPEGGGTPLRVEVPGLREGDYFNPEFLPGEDDFLFEFVPSDSEGAQVYIATLQGGRAVDPRLLLSNETAAAFTPAGGGRILFVRNDNLYSQKLDLKARKLLRDPELLEERVASYAGWRNAHFSVSRAGAIVWRSGTAVVSQVTVFDRKGNRTGVAGTPAPVNIITLSPDESRLLATGAAGAWIVEANGPGRVGLNLLAGGRSRWSPDGSRLINISGTKVVERPVSGPGQLRELAQIPSFEGRAALLDGISPDGRKILFGDGTGLFLFALDGKGVPERIAGQRADSAALSPDGTWIVYRPNEESGVYAQPVSGTGLPRQIASNGSYAVWRGDGKEILYFDRNQNSVSSVRVEGSGENLQFSTPQSLFMAAAPIGTASGSRPLAVNRDGSRIYFLQSEQPDSGVINVRTGAVH